MKYISPFIEGKIRSLEVSHFNKSFPQLFCWLELERLLNLRPFLNSNRFNIISQEQYSWETQTWLSDVNTYPPSIVQKEIQKYVCFLIDCSRVNDKINSVCQELENIFLGCSVDAHIYFDLNKTTNTSFGIHKDESHNLIVQMEGSSEFSIWNQNQDIKDDANCKFILEHGDAVFIPRGIYHKAESLTPRLSVSFPICVDSVYKPQDRTWVIL